MSIWFLGERSFVTISSERFLARFAKVRSKSSQGYVLLSLRVLTYIMCRCNGGITHGVARLRFASADAGNNNVYKIRMNGLYSDWNSL